MKSKEQHKRMLVTMEDGFDIDEQVAISLAASFEECFRRLIKDGAQDVEVQWINQREHNQPEDFAFHSHAWRKKPSE